MRLTKAKAKAVKYACENFHYSKCTPSCQYAYNVYNDNEEWCGCIVFSGGQIRI